MRRLSSLIAIALLAAAAPAFADPHAEMAAALTAQLDTHPARAILPTAVRVQTASTQVGHGAAAAASAAGNGHGNSGSNASANGLAHQAKDGAANAAGQAQAAAAKSRPHSPHPTH